MTTTLRKRLVVAGLAVACAAGLATAGATSASADGVAPPATSHPSVSFVVPVTHNPASTGIEVAGQIEDLITSDDLNGFGVTIVCADGVGVSAAALSGIDSSHHQLFRSFIFSVPLSEQGKRCTIQSSGPANRVLNFGDVPLAKPSDLGDGRLYFTGNVIENVVRRGGQY